MTRFELGGDLVLRPLEESDADELHALIEANRAHLARWMPWAADERRDGVVEFIRGTRRQLDSDDGFQCAIVRAGRIAGVVGHHGIAWPNRSTSLGYWLAAAEQGRGTMTRAVEALTQHALIVRGLNRLEIRAAPDNRRSRAVPERLGFRAEGVLRESEKVGDRYLDSVVYAMLARDWRARMLGPCLPT
jgi:ribosomal-protein-serine acetyltransferase